MIINKDENSFASKRYRNELFKSYKWGRDVEILVKAEYKQSRLKLTSFSQYVMWAMNPIHFT